MKKIGKNSEHIKLYRYRKTDNVLTMMEYSKILAMDYARRCGADYHIVTTHWLDKEEMILHKPGWAKLELFVDSKWIDQYDNILYVDTDCLIWPWAPNVFDIVPSDAFSVANNIGKGKSMGMNPEVRMRIPIDIEYHKKMNFNSGVFVVNRYSFDRMNELFEKYPRWKEVIRDQLVLNALCFSIDGGVKMNFLDNKFNATATKLVSNAKKHYISHLWGIGKDRRSKLYNDFAYPFVEQAKENLEKKFEKLCNTD